VRDKHESICIKNKKKKDDDNDDEVEEFEPV